MCWTPAGRSHRATNTCSAVEHDAFRGKLRGANIEASGSRQTTRPCDKSPAHQVRRAGSCQTRSAAKRVSCPTVLWAWVSTLLPIHVAWVMCSASGGCTSSSCYCSGSVMTDIPDEMQFRENQANILLGQIIRNWASIEQWLLASITLLQGHARARFIRAKSEAGHPDQLDGLPMIEFPYTEFYAEAGDQFTIRVRHLRRLFLALADNATIRRFDAIRSEIDALYEHRNEAAHAMSVVTPSWEDRGVTYSSDEWRDERGFPERRHYSIDQIEQIVARILKLKYDLALLASEVKPQGQAAAPVATPPSRGGRRKK